MLGVRVLLFLAALGYSTHGAQAAQRTNMDELMNVCVDGVNRKQRASAEPNLYGNCSQWSDLSCCTANVSREMHLKEKWENFGYDHCDGHVMSDACKLHFLKDVCFYGCSPNVGPWVKPTTQGKRTEKFIDAPLCQSDCDAWWDDCKADYTCVDNWGKDFNWTGGQNRCPANTTCRPFTEVFHNATRFCEVVWNYSWLVQPDNTACMTVKFAAGANPNREVARQKAREILGTNHAASLRPTSLYIMVSVAAVLGITQYRYMN